MNKKLDEDIWIIRGRLFPPTLIGKVGYGADEDGPSYYRDYTNLDVEAELNSAKKYIEDQFYSKDEFHYVLERIEKRAKEYFETDFSKHISSYAKHDGKYYTGIKSDGEFITNEALNNEYKSIIILKKEKLKLLYDKLIKELSKKYEDAEGYKEKKDDEQPLEFEDFRDKELLIKKKELTSADYHDWLYLMKTIYKNKKFHSTIVGSKRAYTYHKIITLIEKEIELCKAKINTPIPTKPRQNKPLEDITLISETHTLNSESISDYLYNLPGGNQNELDMFNYIEKVTDDFNPFKLKLLLKEVEIVISVLFEDKTPDYKEQQLRVEEWKNKNKEIPYKTIPALIYKGKKHSEEFKTLDIHKLFPEIDIELYSLYQFRNYVTTLINQGKLNTHSIDKTHSYAETSISKNETKISLPAIALKYRYLQITGEHEGITFKNRDEIAIKHKWGAKSSGRKLDSYYKKFQNETDRTNPTILSDEAGYYQSKNTRIEHIKQAVQELASYPKALEIAKKELEKTSK